MKAKIVGQNHKVIPYEVNGRKRYVIEDIQQTARRVIVNKAVAVVGRKWEDVYNYLDEQADIPMSSQLEKTIERMTY